MPFIRNKQADYSKDFNPKSIMNSLVMMFRMVNCSTGSIEFFEDGYAIIIPDNQTVLVEMILLPLEVEQLLIDTRFTFPDSIIKDRVNQFILDIVD